jgi:hypothetical protein
VKGTASMMKYLVYAKWRLEDMDIAIAKMRQYQTSTKQSNKFPQTLFPLHQLLGKSCIISIMEGTDEQITILTLFYQPEISLTVQPLYEFTKMLQLHLDAKKERPEKYTA